MDRYVAAVDLGSTKVVTTVGEKTPEGIKIIAYNEAPSKGIVKGEISNIQNVLDSLRPTVEEVNRMTGLPVKSVLTGIAGQNIKCIGFTNEKRRKYPSELITEDEIEELKREMFNTRVGDGERILHVVPQSYNIDDHINVTEPVGMIGETIEGNYLLFIGKTSATDNCTTVMKRAGLSPGNLILEPIASARAVLTDDEKEIGVALVDIGGATTDLIIIKDNIIRYAALIPFAGNSITDDIRSALGVPAKYAELMKIHFGACFSGYAEETKSILLPGAEGTSGKEISLKKLSEIIEARVSEIIATVNHEIEKSGFSNKIPGGLVLTGGSSNLAFIRHLAKAITGYDIRLAKPSHTLTDDSVEEAYKASSSTAIGLVLMGFDYLERAEESAVPQNEEEESENEALPADGTLFGKEYMRPDNDKGGSGWGRSKRREREKVVQVKSEKPPKEKNKSNGKGLFGGILGIFDESSNDNGA